MPKTNDRNVIVIGTKKGPWDRWLIVLNCVQFGLLAVVTGNDLIGPERWWGGSLNEYLPQWIWGLPTLLLLPASAILCRRLIWMPLISLIWVGFPIMGFCVPLRMPAQPPPGTSIRVMTYNVKWGRRDSDAIKREIEDRNPDVLLLQDSMETGTVFASVLAKYHVSVSGQFVIASRNPVLSSEDGWIPYRGQKHHYLRCVIQVAGSPVTVCCVHLLTSREGLAAVKTGAVGGISALSQNAADRVEQSEELARDVRGFKGPVIVAGDLNSTPHSLVCHNLKQSGLKDAFAEGGWGFGYTYGQYQRLRHAYLRIDNIMTSSDFYVERAWVGNGIGSDHCPLIAELVLPNSGGQ